MRVPLLAAFISAILAVAPLAGAAPSATSSPVRLSEDRGRGDRVGPLLFRGGLHLRSADAGFGGLSALRVSPDGSQFVAVTDRGAVVNGRLSYRPDGTLSGAGPYQLRPLAGADGQPLGAGQRDSEGLAILGAWPGDGWVVSFEREHRLVRYPAALAGVAGKVLQGPPGIGELPLNNGLETLAVLPDGRLVAVAEADSGEGRHRAWLGRPGDWRSFTYQALPPFLPVDAAPLPGGDLLVLERRASWIGGWGTRLVRVTGAALERAAAAGGVAEGTELARLDPPLLVDNFEGVDVRPGKDGRLYLYLVSDDNFSILQRTLLLMFELPPG